MRSGALCPTLSAVLVLSAGCASHRAQPVPAERSSPELVSRLQAAAAISDAPTRDRALADVAWLGAQAGDARIVLDSLGAITDSAVRDKAACECSARLVEDGWVPQATAVAKVIRDSAVRDRALSKIAESSPYPIAPP